MQLPVDYTKLDWRKGEVRAVREQYIKEQGGVCMYCLTDLREPPPESVTDKPINWSLFPRGEGFLDYPIHLHHDHFTNMTEGAVHAYCNAVLFQYHGK